MSSFLVPCWLLPQNKTSPSRHFLVLTPTKKKTVTKNIKKHTHTRTQTHSRRDERERGSERKDYGKTKKKKFGKKEKKNWVALPWPSSGEKMVERSPDSIT